jgi:methylglutamate dehydrogenase subunit D
VSEPALLPQSPLARIVAPGPHGVRVDTPGVVITPRHDLALATVIARADKASELANRVSARYGLDLPLTPKRVSAGALSFTWAGPGQWLAAMEQTAGHTFEKNLRGDLAGLASIANQTDGRSCIRLGGPMARRTLAKGIPIDLHPECFGPGDTVLTAAGHINVHFWQLDHIPTYEFAVFRSFAAAFCQWLLEASAEFGAVVTKTR